MNSTAFCPLRDKRALTLPTRNPPVNTTKKKRIIALSSCLTSTGAKDDGRGVAVEADEGNSEIPAFGGSWRVPRPPGEGYVRTKLPPPAPHPLGKGPHMSHSAAAVITEDLHVGVALVKHRALYSPPSETRCDGEARKALSTRPRAKRLLSCTSYP